MPEPLIPDKKKISKEYLRHELLSEREYETLFKKDTGKEPEIDKEELMSLIEKNDVFNDDEKKNLLEDIEEIEFAGNDIGKDTIIDGISEAEIVEDDINGLGDLEKGEYEIKWLEEFLNPLLYKHLKKDIGNYTTIPRKDLEIVIKMNMPDEEKNIILERLGYTTEKDAVETHDTEDLPGVSDTVIELPPTDTYPESMFKPGDLEINIDLWFDSENFGKATNSIKREFMKYLGSTSNPHADALMERDGRTYTKIKYLYSFLYGIDKELITGPYGKGGSGTFQHHFGVSRAHRKKQQK